MFVSSLAHHSSIPSTSSMGSLMSILGSVLFSDWLHSVYWLCTSRCLKLKLLKCLLTVWRRAAGHVSVVGWALLWEEKKSVSSRLSTLSVSERSFPSDQLTYVNSAHCGLFAGTLGWTWVLWLLVPEWNSSFIITSVLVLMLKEKDENMGDNISDMPRPVEGKLKETRLL